MLLGSIVVRMKIRDICNDLRLVLVLSSRQTVLVALHLTQLSGALLRQIKRFAYVPSYVISQQLSSRRTLYWLLTNKGILSKRIPLLVTAISSLKSVCRAEGQQVTFAESLKFEGDLARRPLYRSSGCIVFHVNNDISVVFLHISSWRRVKATCPSLQSNGIWILKIPRRQYAMSSILVVCRLAAQDIRQAIEQS